MELPTAYNLSTEKRPDGKLNIVGKDDAGEAYVARVTSGPEVQETDVAALAQADREHSTPWDFTHSVIKENDRTRQEWQDDMLADFLEPAERVAHAGLHKETSTIGSTRTYRENFDKWYQSLNGD